jgi:hypothetical protein
MPYFGAEPASELANLDINGQKFILDADADTHITADTDDQIDIAIAGADDFQFTANKFLVQTGSNLDMNGTELILDADADTSITADTDDQIDIRIAGADDFQFTANTFTAQSGSTITTPTLGVGATKDLGAALHVKSADSGASAHAAADEIVIEGSAASGLSILSANDNTGSIYWADDGSTFAAYQIFSHSTNYMSWGMANTNPILQFNEAGHVAIRDGGINASMTTGLTINQQGADNEILALKSSDVAHGITNYAEADTYASFKKVSATAGGLLIQGFAESGSATGIQFNAMSEAAPSTGAGTGAQATCKHYAVLSDGSAGFAAFASNSIIHAWGLFTSGGSAQLKMCLDEDGDLFLDGAVGTAFDSYDDAALLRAFSNHSSPDQVIKTSFDKWVGYNLEDLQAARIISDPGEDEGRPMWNIGQHTKLLTGAAVQQRAMFETMKEVAEDMLPGFAEKLNKKLAEQSLPALPVSA